MDNKLMSLIIKIGMGVLLLIGVVLISNNLGFDATGEEPIANQEFFKETYTLPAVDGKKAVDESIVRFDYVLDNDKKVVYDLTNSSTYEMGTFVSSKGETKTKAGDYKAEDVDPVLMNEYDLQGATGKSIVYTQWLMYGGLILILLFTVVNIIQNPKRFIRLAIGLVLLVGITIICYYSVDAVGTGKVTQLSNYSDTSFHMSATAILMFIVLTVIAVAMILFGIVSGALRYFQK
jgi:hypothetical protein